MAARSMLCVLLLGGLTVPINLPAFAQDPLLLIPAQERQRQIPDTRYLTRVLWIPAVIDSLSALEARSDSSGLEEGICIYGGWYDRNTLVVHYAASPTRVQNQTNMSISVQCQVTPQFIGIAHTHTTAIDQDDLRGDAYLLRISEHALISVAVHGGYLAWVSREAESMPWRYRR